MVTHLPCIKCGTSLSIIEGSLVQCFNCGTKNVYSDSIASFRDYLLEILNLTSVDEDSDKIDNEEIERRKNSINSYFHTLNSDFYSYDRLILTKLDDIEIDPQKLLNIIRIAGNLVIINDDFLLPYLKESLSKNQFQEIRDLAFIFNKALLGLYFCYLAKEKFQLEDCSNYYQFAERNYNSIIEYCENIKLENPSFDTNDIKIFYKVVVKFSVILRNILSENPAYSSEKLEDILKSLDKIENKNLQVLNLQSQIHQIYDLGKNTSLLLEELRVADIFSVIDPYEENLIFKTEEILENLDRIKNWIDDVSAKYQIYQKSLLKLHSGKFIDYLESYRAEFNNRKNKCIEKFDELLERIISRALSDYNFETIEILEILNNFIQKLDSREVIIQRFEIEHKDLLKLGEGLKRFIIELFKKVIQKDLESIYYKELIMLISDKHSEFDKYILKYINSLLKEFEDYRNEKVLSLEEQRNHFILELKPNISRLIDSSFTLNEDLIPYPLFIEIIILSKQLTVNNPEAITVLIENPSTTEIKNVNISFFMPNSFQSKLRFAQLKRIKPFERRKIETEVVPTEKGIFHFMVMVEYSHTGEDFWMPSIRVELEVEEEL
ncbi:MAG: hypothetical protein ACTSQG_02855 [Promethearchaeota archaeon]